MKPETKLIPTKDLWPNDGQMASLPKNPRFIRDDKFDKLVNSIREDPEMLNLRELLVFPYADAYIIIAGNMRFRACIEAGLLKVPCKIIPTDTPIDKLKAIVIKDNIGYGEHDFDALANDWDQEQLLDWGVDLPGFDGSDIGSDGNGSDDPSEDVGVGMGDGESTIIKIVVTITHPDHVDDIKADIEEILEGYEGTSVTVLGIDNEFDT